MSNENTVAISVQMRLEEMFGADEAKRKLAEISQEAMNVGKNFNENLQQETHRIEQQLGTRLNKYDKGEIRGSLAVTKMLTEDYTTDMNELLDNLTFDAQFGLTKSEKKRYAKQAYELKKQTNERLDDHISETKKRMGKHNSPEGRETLEKHLTMYQDFKGRTNDVYDKMINRLKEANDETSKLKKETEGLFDVLKKGGWLMLGNVVAKQAMAFRQGLAEIKAKNLTSFDLRSPEGMFFEAEGAELFERTKKRSMYGKVIGGGLGLIGGLIGGGLGLLSGGLGTPALAAGGAAVGAGLGDYVAGIFSTEERGEKGREWKFLQQTFGKAQQYYQIAGNYETQAKKSSIRFGENLRGSSGLGYTAEQELVYKSLYGEARGRFDEEDYESKLIFARARGLSPELALRFGNAERISGEKWGIEKFETARNISKEIFGADADEKRTVNILENLQTLLEKQLEVSIKASSKDLEKALMLPNMIFGKDSPYGNEYSGRTLNTLKGLMKPKNDAHLAFLYQALGHGHSLIEFNEILKGGLFGKSDNFKKIMETVNKTSGGNSDTAYWVLEGLLGNNAPQGFSKRLAEITSGKGKIVSHYEDKQGKKYKHKDVELRDGNKFFIKGTDKEVTAKMKKVSLEEFFEHFQKLIKEGVGGKKAAETLIGMKSTAKDAASPFEKVAEEIKKVQLEVGKGWGDRLNKSRMTMARIEKNWLSSSESMLKVGAMLEKGFDALRTKMGELGVYKTKKDIDKEYEEKKEKVRNSESIFYLKHPYGGGTIRMNTEKDKKDKLKKIDELHKKELTRYNYKQTKEVEVLKQDSRIIENPLIFKEQKNEVENSLRFDGLENKKIEIPNGSVDDDNKFSLSEKESDTNTARAVSELASSLENFKIAMQNLPAEIANGIKENVAFALGKAVSQMQEGGSLINYKASNLAEQPNIADNV